MGCSRKARGEENRGVTPSQCRAREQAISHEPHIMHRQELRSFNKLEIFTSRIGVRNAVQQEVAA